METTPLLKLIPGAQFSVGPVASTSISRSAREALRQEAAATARSAIELHVASEHLALVRTSSAQNGNAEVLGQSGLFLATEDGHLHPVDLAIQCRATGPIHVTTYDEWISQD